MMTATRKRPTDDDLTALAARVRGAIVPLARQLRHAAGDGVTPSQSSVIGSLDRHGPATLGELAARERLSPPMITKIVGALEELGYVERLPDTRDRRVHHARLTSAGQRWLTDTRARRNAWLAARVAALSADERTLLESALPVLERLVEEDDAR